MVNRRVARFDRLLHWRILAPLTILSFTLVSKWWWVQPVDAPDTLLSGFPLPWVGSAWHTSMALQIFLGPMLFNLLFYLLTWLIVLSVVERFTKKISLPRWITWSLWLPTTFIVIVSTYIASWSDQIITWNRNWEMHVSRTGLLLAGNALHHSNESTGTLAYETLPVDTSNSIVFPFDTTFYWFPRGSRPTRLTPYDIHVTDSLLNQAIEFYNDHFSRGAYLAFDSQAPMERFCISLPDYKRQYFAYEDINGQRMLVVNCFSRPFPDWRTRSYGGGNHFGISHFQLDVNLTTKTADGVSISGY